MKFSQPTSRTIFLVDDEPAILSFQRALFEALGYYVLTAESGEEALNMMQTRPVDLVVLDYLMPTMDGEETARRIRRAHSGIPIVMSSGVETLPQSLLEIVNASVDKGRGLAALVHAVEKLLPPVT